LETKDQQERMAPMVHKELLEVLVQLELKEQRVIKVA
tara:strand:- start:1359 stop:1469 length:111 start_codon:yes stop_codon:yes gene_type:complete